MHPLGDELQDLMARLISRAHELGIRGIYRGEPECFPRISSGLYRQLYEIDDPSFHIGAAQRRRIELAQRYAPDLSDNDVLTRLQHLGGKTNLIDFTRDLNVALFFSSYHSHDKDGRVILMEEPFARRDEREMFAAYVLVSRGNPASMTDVQKGVWVEPRSGHIDDDDVTIIEIPRGLKPEILSHLRAVYGIEASTVYNDLSGFIRDQDRLRDPDAEWHAGVRACEAGHYESALGFFAQYEQLVDAPRLDLEYYRAISYWHAGLSEEGLAAMASFRTFSPRNPQAFSEEMESAYAARRRQEVDGRRQTDGETGAPVAEVVPGFRTRLVGDAGRSDGTTLRMSHESGHGRELVLDEKERFLAFPGVTPEATGAWLLSLNGRGYQGVELEPLNWPIQKTLVQKAIDGDAPDVTVEIESLQYTYEPGFEGPVVAYPARGEGDGRSAE
ncbi:MAG: FRG domain-containing protein [Dehalococcoidia bacterium]|nr:FRG domain-containing protein [Dehalococcoidia bacterium]